MVASDATATGWTPPNIPNTWSASLQSWLSRGNHHSTPHSRSATASASPSQPPSTTSSSSSSVASASGSASAQTPGFAEGPSPAAADEAAASLPNTPALSPPVKLSYPGRYDELAAQAELYLYSLATPYLKGARIGNVRNDASRGDASVFDEMWAETQGRASPTDITSEDGKKTGGHLTHHSSGAVHAEERATMGTQCHSDGKVAAIRWVSVDPAEEEAGSSSGAGSSWLSYLTLRGGHKSNRPKKALNVLEIGKPGTSENQSADSSEEKVVLLHGYGAGTGFFFQNITALANRPNSRLFAIDWLGMGRSSRPPYHVPSEAVHSDLTRVQAAESWFVDSLEEWRKKAGIEKMKLVGHSLGGYLGVAYALRHPTRVSRLVLVSPAGVGASPDDQQAADGADGKSPAESKTFEPKNATWIPEASRGNIDADAASIHSVEREVLEPQSNTVPATESQAETDASQLQKATSTSAGGDGEQTKGAPPMDAHGREKRPPPRFSPWTRSVFAWLWEQNFSPFGLLRTAHFAGPLLMSRYTERRFGSLPPEELKALHAYCQGVFLAKGSGEYCLVHLLKPGAWARVPIVDRIAGLHKDLPVSFIYGEHDWMDVTAGREVVSKLKHQLGNPFATNWVVPHAGHHVYLDNPRAFDRLLARILDGKAEKVTRQS